MNARPVQPAPRRLPRPARRAPRVLAGRRGFSFTEVLFAVMILGVGFIMVAAIFPVAIQQAQYTSTEGNAAALARGLVGYLEQTLTNADMPAIPPPGPPPTPGMPGPRARVYSLRDPQQARNQSTQFGPFLSQYTAPGWTNGEQLWNRVKGNLINANDPRYGCVVLYRREVGSPYAQVFVIVTQSRSRPIYEPAKDLVPPAGDTYANLQARAVMVNVTSDGERPLVDQTLTITPPNQPAALAAAEGCYVIIANSNLTPVAGNPARQGWLNGRIYRLGNKVAGTLTTFELMPGNDFQKDPGPDGSSGVVPGDTTDDVTGLTGADAFIVGRTYNGRNGSPPWDGPAQDVAVYTTFIQLR